MIVWVIGAALFYFAERDNPRMDGAFQDLPSSLYYCAVFLGGEWGKIDFTPLGFVVCIFYCVVGCAVISFSNLRASSDIFKYLRLGFLVCEASFFK